MTAGRFIFVYISLAAVLAGCETGPVVISLDVAGVQPGTATDDLAAVLKRCVNKNGFIDPDKFPDVATPLEQQLKRLAVTGPEETPELVAFRQDRLAYWYNARTAWSVELAMRLHRQKKDDAGELARFVFPLDGRQRKLSDIDAAIEALGGYMDVVAAPGADLRRAALPQAPFQSQTVRDDVRKRFTDFVDDGKRFDVNVSTMTVRFPPVLWRFREAILADNRRQYGTPEPTLTTALLPLVHGSALRRLQDAIGYRCVEDTSKAKLAITE
jgi:hypothetical protein